MLFIVVDLKDVGKNALDSYEKIHYFLKLDLLLTIWLKHSLSPRFCPGLQVHNWVLSSLRPTLLVPPINAESLTHTHTKGYHSSLVTHRSVKQVNALHDTCLQ